MNKHMEIQTPVGGHSPVRVAGDDGPLGRLAASALVHVVDRPGVYYVPHQPGMFGGADEPAKWLLARRTPDDMIVLRTLGREEALSLIDAARDIGWDRALANFLRPTAQVAFS